MPKYLFLFHDCNFEYLSTTTLYWNAHFKQVVNMSIHKKGPKALAVLISTFHQIGKKPIKPNGIKSINANNCLLSLLACRRAGPTRTRSAQCPPAWVVLRISLQTPTPWTPCSDEWGSRSIRVGCQTDRLIWFSPACLKKKYMGWQPQQKLPPIIQFFCDVEVRGRAIIGEGDITIYY